MKKNLYQKLTCYTNREGYKKGKFTIPSSLLRYVDVRSQLTIGEFEYGIESAEVNHKAQVLRFLITYTLNLGDSFKKSRLLSVVQ